MKMKNFVRNFKAFESAGEESVKIGELTNNWEKYFPMASNESEIILVTNSQDVMEIQRYIDGAEDFDGFFVFINNGDYETVYGFMGNVPNVNKMATKLL